MINPRKCCGDTPLVWWPASKFDSKVDQITTIEKIECQICGRVIYGSDEESVESWNNGENDDA